MLDDSTKTAILILGAHRSGTSALTRMISYMGYTLPQNLMASLDGNEAGHWESEAVAQMNDGILEELELQWFEWHPYRLDKIGSKRKSEIIEDLRSVFEKEYPNPGNIVIKDPRICRLTEFAIPAILQVATDLKVVIPFRNPLEVMASLNKRNGLSKPQAGLIWLRYVLDAEYGSRGLDRTFISFNDYLTAPQKSMSELCKTLKLKPQISASKLKTQFETFARADLKHHNFDPALLMANPVTRGWIQETLESHVILQSNPNDTGAQKTLDKIRLQFEQVTPLLKASLDALYLQQKANATNLEANSDLLNQQLNALKEQEDANRSNYDAMVQEYETITQDRLNLRADLGKSEGEKQKSNAAVEALTLNQEALKTKLEALEAQTQFLAQENDALSTKLNAVKDEKKQLSKTLEQSEHEREALIRSYIDSSAAKDVKVSELLGKHKAMNSELDHIRARLRQEQQTVVKPFMRNVRRAGGSILRVFLPNTAVAALAMKVPTSEQKLILEQRKATKDTKSVDGEQKAR